MPDIKTLSTPPVLLRREGTPKYYSNSTNIEVSIWDFNLIFGELKLQGDPPTIESVVEVRMSPQHAKVLAHVLMTNVHEYEKHVGEIKLPPESVQPKM